MRIRPNSLGYTLLLGTLAALPPLAIDMGLPAIAALSTFLNASPTATGLTLRIARTSLNRYQNSHKT